MAAEDNNNKREEEKNEEVKKATKEATGKESEEGKEKPEDHDKEIDKENKFYVMPTEESVSRSSGGESHKVMGIIIMICGIIVIVGGIYFSYVYLIASPGGEEVAQENRDSEESQQPQQKDAGQQEPSSTTEKEKEEGTEESTTPGEETSPAETEDGEKDKTTGTSSPEESTATTSKEEEQEEEDKEATSTPQETVAEDSDDDGLTDAEEDIFGTKVSKTDTDGDGYTDGEEVLNLYNPNAKEEPLATNPNIASYTNDQHGYSLLYPDSWTTRQVGGEESLMFKSSGKEFVQVIVQENQEGVDIEEWYSQQFPEEEVNEENIVETETWKGIKKTNKSIYYLTNGDKKNIYVISYAAPQEVTPHYPTVFKMMVKSFEVETD